MFGLMKFSLASLFWASLFLTSLFGAGWYGLTKLTPAGNSSASRQAQYSQGVDEYLEGETGNGPGWQMAGWQESQQKSNPKELGRVRWRRGVEAAKTESKKSGKPIFVLFQEVPG